MLSKPRFEMFWNIRQDWKQTLNTLFISVPVLIFLAVLLINPAAFRIEIPALESSDIKVFLFCSALYLVSHTLRALRIWILLKDHSIPILHIVLAQVVSTGVFLVTANPIIGEITKFIFMAGLIAKNYMKIPIAIFYGRIFDFLVLPIPVLYFYSQGSQVEGFLSGSFRFFSLALFCLFLIFTLKPFAEKILIYILKYRHDNLSLQLFKSIKALLKFIDKMELNRFSTINATLVVTIAYWSLDFLTYYTVFVEYTESSAVTAVTQLYHDLFGGSFGKPLGVTVKTTSFLHLTTQAPILVLACLGAVYAISKRLLK